MGTIFPVFSLLFVDRFKSTLCYIIFFGSCIAAGIIVGLISFFIGKATLIRFIGMISDEMQAIAEGKSDLTRRIEINSADQVGKMAEHFNRFMGSLQKIIEKINDSAIAAAGSAVELSAVSSQISSNTSEMSHQTSTVASSTGQVSTSFADITVLASDMSSTADAVAQAMTTLKSSINDVAQHCEKELLIAEDAKKHIHNGKSHISQLAAAASDIGNVINLILKISEKTNLLALNATIEAATAGDAGKGFAVVAEEVKALSRQTASATTDIAQQIETMRSTTNSVIQSIDALLVLIDNVYSLSRGIADAVGEQNRAVFAISGTSNEVKSRSRIVSDKINDSAKGLSEVTASLNAIALTIKETATGISQITHSATDLSAVSESLRMMVSEFRV